MMRCWIAALLAGLVAAENGLDAWLRYAPLPSSAFSPSVIVTTNSSKSSPVYVAGQELQKGIQSLFKKHVNVSHDIEAFASSPSVLVGTTKDYKSTDVVPLKEDGYILTISANQTVILGQNERGALYGAFEYLSRLARGNFSDVSIVSSPDAPIRWVNEWDNLDGSIERGYAGPSIFFSNGVVTEDLTRVALYARLLASVGINGTVINNVNANPPC